MKIVKKFVTMQTSFVKPIINLERPLEKVLKKGEYIASTCYNTPGDNNSKSYEINPPYNGGGSHEEWLVWRDKWLKALDSQDMSTELQKYMFTEHLLTGDVKHLPGYWYKYWW